MNASEVQHIELDGFQSAEPHPSGAALYIHVDPQHAAHGSAFEAGHFLKAGTPYRVVHVVSRWRGGEVRGYILADGKLFLQSTMDWPELDERVQRELGATVEVRS